MNFYEYGDPKNPKIILIHGFLSPYQICEPFIKAFEKDYFITVPVLPGHDPENPEEFISLDKTTEEILDYYIPKFGNEVFAIYGMSMGGVFAAKLLESEKLRIDKIIMESSPLLPWENFVIKFMTKYYLNITHKAQKRVPGVLKQAVGSMVPEDKLSVFLELLDCISDGSIEKYIFEIGKYSLTFGDSANSQIYYLYGGKINEILFKQAAKKVKKHYPTAKTLCIKGKGHCEDALIHPEIQIGRIKKILNNA